MYLDPRFAMSSRLLVPLIVLAVVPFAQAQTRFYEARGAVTSATTQDVGGNALPASTVQQEYLTGTPIALRFAYDPAAPVAAASTNEAIYDAPFAVTGTIGNRRFSANASLVNVIDDTASFPGGTGDLLQFRIDPILSRDYNGVTDANIAEANPFTTSTLRLDYFFVQFGRRGGGAFSGTSLPNSIDLAQYDANLFFFDYYDGANTETTVRGNVASVTPVPEPATLAALGLGAAALLRRRRA